MTTKIKTVNFDIDGKIHVIKVKLDLAFDTETYGPGLTLTRNLNRFSIILDTKSIYVSKTYRDSEEDSMLDDLDITEVRLKRKYKKLYGKINDVTLNDKLKQKGFV